MNQETKPKKEEINTLTAEVKVLQTQNTSGKKSPKSNSVSKERKNVKKLPNQRPPW